MQQLFDEKNPEIIQSTMSDEAYNQIFRIFSQHAIEETGMDGFNEEPVSFEIFDNDKLVAILVAQIYWGQFHIRYLVVEKAYRSKGLGSKLIAKALDFAKSKGCGFAYLESMNFHKPEFYENFGFKVDFIQKGFARNTSFYYMSKQLI